MLSWFRGRRFSPPDSPLRDYWLTVHVKLEPPLRIEDGQKVMVGYLRILGMRCTPLRLHSFVAETVNDGSVEWDKTTWTPVSINSLSRSLRNAIDPLQGECLWHQSGCIYFQADA